MKEQWRREDDTIDSIEQAAMSRNQLAHILDLHIAFDVTDRQIAQLTADTNDNSGEDSLRRGEFWQHETHQPRQRHGNDECPD